MVAEIWDWWILIGGALSPVVYVGIFMMGRWYEREQQVKKEQADE